MRWRIGASGGSSNGCAAQQLLARRDVMALNSLLIILLSKGNHQM
jgi:hypothetical protein